MKQCPFLKKKCLEKECNLYVPSFRKCSFAAIPLQLKRVADKVDGVNKCIDGKIDLLTEMVGSTTTGSEQDGTQDGEIMDAAEILAEPAEIIEETDDSTEEPEETVEEPDDFAEEPEEPVEEPEEPVEEPDDPAEEPEEPVEEPDEAIEEPEDVADEAEEVSEEEVEDVAVGTSGNTTHWK